MPVQRVDVNVVDMAWNCRKPYNQLDVFGDLNATPRNDDWLQAEWFEMTMRPKLTERGSIHIVRTMYTRAFGPSRSGGGNGQERDVAVSPREDCNTWKGGVANLKILFSRPSATATSSSGRRGATFAQSLLHSLSPPPARHGGWLFPRQGCAGGNHIT